MQTLEEKKAVHRLSQKRYKLSKKGKITQKKYYFSEAKKKSSLKYYYENQYKYRVHNKVDLAIKKGILVKQPCEICKKVIAFAHHDDYSKPLNVRWLCNYHHCEFHRNNKN